MAHSITSRRALVFGALAVPLLPAQLWAQSSISVTVFVSDVSDFCGAVSAMGANMDGEIGYEAMSRIEDVKNKTGRRFYDNIDKLDLSTLSEADLERLEVAVSRFRECFDRYAAIEEEWQDALFKAGQSAGSTGAALKRKPRRRMEDTHRRVKKLIHDLKKLEEAND